MLLIHYKKVTFKLLFYVPQTPSVYFPQRGVYLRHYLWQSSQVAGELAGGQGDVSEQRQVREPRERLGLRNSQLIEPTWEVEDRFPEDVRAGLGCKAEWDGHRGRGTRLGKAQGQGRHGGSAGRREVPALCVRADGQRHCGWWQGHFWKSPRCHAKDLTLLPGGSREPSKILQARADGPVWPCS